MTEVRIPDDGGNTIRMADVGGFITPIFFRSAPEIKDIYDKLSEYKFRNDDLMLCTFAKTGTNWVYEILMMIQNRSAERVKTLKVSTMLECVTAEEADKEPSPRVMNCHFSPKRLPLEDMKAKQIKTVLCLRNPKDTAVSYYNHMKGLNIYEYNGKWEDWFPVYTQGKLEYGKYSDYLLEWQQLIQENPGFPLHIMYFEDLKENGREELDRLLKFLDVELNDQLKENIMDMCGFDKMQDEKAKTLEVMESLLKDGFNFFRKGQVGDWKNWFTVAQNEMFGNIWEKETKDLSSFKFRYTLE